MKKQTQYGHEEGRLISRFTIAVLGCSALGMAIGRSMPTEHIFLAATAGGLAFLFYVYESRRDLHLRRQQSETCREVAELRLTQHVAKHYPKDSHVHHSHQADVLLLPIRRPNWNQSDLPLDRFH